MLSRVRDNCSRACTIVTNSGNERPDSPGVRSFSILVAYAKMAVKYYGMPPSKGCFWFAIEIVLGETD